MDFVILGAGAVGAVVGTLLVEAGHRVRFWVRPKQRLAAASLSIERVGGARVHVDSPDMVCSGESIEGCDWVLVCVRGEQLTDALSEVVQHFGPHQRVAIAAVSLQPLGERARAAGLLGPVLAMYVAFGSHAEPAHPSHFLWFPFSAPTTITPEGHAELLPDARQLAHVLNEAGLPSTARLSLGHYIRFMTAVLSVLTLSWDVSRWELRALAADVALRRQTARAMRESVGLLFAPGAWQRHLPVWLYDNALKAAARLMSENGRTVWRHHGPKIRGQSDALVREILQLPAAQAQPTAALVALYERWQRFCATASSGEVPAPSSTSRPVRKSHVFG